MKNSQEKADQQTSLIVQLLSLAFMWLSSEAENPEKLKIEAEEAFLSKALAEMSVSPHCQAPQKPGTSNCPL